MDRLEVFGKMIDAFFEGTRIFHKYEKIPRKYGTDIELYMSEMHTLDYISKNEGTTVTNLANITKKTKSAITQLTNKLEKKGFIKKPCYFNLILGNIACAQANLLNLGLMVNELPDNSTWSAGGIGNHQLKMNTMAMVSGSEKLYHWVKVSD